MRRLDKTAPSQIYEVPLIGTDLRQEEFIHQIADSLEYLQHVMDDVFKRVEDRVGQNRTRLAKIEDRTRLAQAKVDHLKGRKKATQVFSSSKYPAPDKLDEYKSLFDAKNYERMKHANFKLTNTYQSPPTDQDLKDKLKFYSVQISGDKNSHTDVEGLGKLPTNINSVSSLLLFNTAENPYKKYVLLDPRGVVTKTRTPDDEEGLRGPDEAPTTITSGEAIESGQRESFNYRPDLGEVPTISLPDTLPDLMDVADDMMYGADLGPSIAPSVFSTLPDLPDIEPDMPLSSSVSAPSGTSAPPPPPPSTSAAPAPPPPPPPSAAAPPPPPPPVAAIAPPPPPPPPPSAGPAPPPPAATGPPPPPPADAPADISDDGGRSSLMAAIRNAGGAGKIKLKKAAERKIEKKKEKKMEESVAPPSSGGGDLMSDLANKLRMRRVGIAGDSVGAKKSSNNDEVPKPPPPSSVPEGGGVMSKMSDLIQYNPVNNDQEDDDDDEW